MARARPCRLGAVMDQSVSRRIVEANGLRFDILECGAGERVAILLHGFPEHAVSWRRQMPALARFGWRVWAVNQRGYGGTDAPGAVSAYALDALLGDVAALIDAAGAREVLLVGHDWGGAVAWSFAASGLRPIARLAVLNMPHPACFAAALRHPRQLLRSWYIGFFQVPGLPDWLLSRNGGEAVRRIMLDTARHPERFDEASLRIYCDNAAQRATPMLNWYRAALRHPTRLDLRRRIEIPTLLVWGERDMALDAITLQGTERYAPDLTLHRIPDASHWVQQDAPEEVNAALDAFLRRA